MVWRLIKGMASGDLKKQQSNSWFDVNKDLSAFGMVTLWSPKFRNPVTDRPFVQVPTPNPEPTVAAVPSRFGVCLHTKSPLFTRSPHIRPPSRTPQNHRHHRHASPPHPCPRPYPGPRCGARDGPTRRAAADGGGGARRGGARRVRDGAGRYELPFAGKQHWTNRMHVCGGLEGFPIRTAPASAPAPPLPRPFPLPPRRGMSPSLVRPANPLIDRSIDVAVGAGFMSNGCC